MMSRFFSTSSLINTKITFGTVLPLETTKLKPKPGEE